MLLAGRHAFRAVAVVFGIVVVLSIWLVGEYGGELGVLGQLSVVFTGSALLNVGLAVFFATVWKPLWQRCPRLSNWAFPHLEGLWDVKIHWERKHKKGTVRAQAVIRLSFLKLSIDLDSEDSTSTTLSVVPKRHPESGEPELHYLYIADPKGYPEDKQPHKGAAILRLGLVDKDVMQGNYFTDRASKGQYEMKRISRGLVA